MKVNKAKSMITTEMLATMYTVLGGLSSTSSSSSISSKIKYKNIWVNIWEKHSFAGLKLYKYINCFPVLFTKNISIISLFSKDFVVAVTEAIVTKLVKMSGFS